MGRRFRLLLILVLMAVSFSFLLPSLKWYAWTQEDQKEISSSSSNQIRSYALRKANEDFERLSSLDPQEPIPKEFQFLIEHAKERFRLERKPLPKRWSVRDILSSFAGKEDILYEIENKYREEVFALKEMRNSRIVQLGLDLRGGMYVAIEADLEELEKTQEKSLSVEEKEDAIRRALEILNNRIDQFGLVEPRIRRESNNRIIVEIPGVADPGRMNTFIKGKGNLNFHIVDDDALSAFKEYQSTRPGDFLDPDGSLKDPDVIPKGNAVRGVYEKDNYGVDQLKGYTVIQEEIGLSGTYIRDARVGRDQITNQPTVNFFLTSEGGDIFYKLTSENVDKILAVVLDDKVKATARIAEPIRDSVRVTGFGESEANDLALVLRTGALPVPLRIVTQQAIGATLGEDSIRQGLLAITVGFLLIIIFMVAYYKLAGLIADLALILNLYFVVSVLSVFNFTLTLPSIAGLILTVGMAVDANVIIFERIKEEYRTGKSVSASIKSGFTKAFWTIMDANITTFIAALALSQLGKGSIQGFAITLAIGIVFSVFTALFVSRLIFEFSCDVLKMKRLNVSWRPVR